MIGSPTRSFTLLRKVRAAAADLRRTGGSGHAYFASLKMSNVPNRAHIIRYKNISPLELSVAKGDGNQDGMKFSYSAETFSGGGDGNTLIRYVVPRHDSRIYIEMHMFYRSDNF